MWLNQPTRSRAVEQDLPVAIDVAEGHHQRGAVVGHHGQTHDAVAGEQPIDLLNRQSGHAAPLNSRSEAGAQNERLGRPSRSTGQPVNRQPVSALTLASSAGVGSDTLYSCWPLDHRILRRVSSSVSPRPVRIRS